MSTATAANKGILRYCDACKKKTRHGPVADTDERLGVIRCHVCGQRPDRPMDGTTIMSMCPNCDNPKKCKATYRDEDGMDCYLVDCPECGSYYRSHDEVVDANDGQRKRDRNDAQILATSIWNANKGNKRLQRISITIGSYTAVVDRKD